MNYSNLPLDTHDLVCMMKARGLQFADEQRAEKELMVISYFRLADYLTPLEADKATHRFKTGATLDDGRNGMIHILFFDPYHEINP